MKFLLLGARGQIGRELARSLACIGEVVMPLRGELNLQELTKIKPFVLKTAPDFIVNAAAYTAVDAAEFNREPAFVLNAFAVKEIASAAEKIGAWVFHYSTDYIFDGKKSSAYFENDKPGPLNTYGASKLAGEVAIIENCSKYLIFRTSWVYSTSQSNFLHAMLGKFLAGGQIRVISDSIGAPTDAVLIAELTTLIAHNIATGANATGRDIEGIYNLVASGSVSWFEYARRILALAREFGYPVRASACDILPVSAEAYPMTARRPLNSVMDTEKVRARFQLNIPTWDVRLRDFFESQSRRSF